MKRSNPRGLCAAVAGALLLAAVPSAGAQERARVVATLGDTGEATCVQAQGEALSIGTLGAGVFRVHGAEPQQRFDATRGLAGNRVRDCALHAGALWVATEAGLARFDARAARFHSVLPGRFLRVAAAGRALVAARGDGVVHRFENGVAAGVQATGSVPAALVIAPDGRWALGGMDGALHLGRGAEVRRVPVAERAGVPAEPIEGLVEAGAIVATTASRELRVEGWTASAAVQSVPRAMKLAERAASPVPAGVLVHDATRFAGGEVFATDAGVFVQRAAGEPAVPLALAGQPCGDRISALAVQGALLWVGSFDRGLCRFDGRSWAHFRAPADLPSDMINALAVAGDSLYVATAQGLAVVDGAGAFTSFTHEQCAGRLGARCPWHAAVNGVAADGARGQIWVADVAALHRIDARTGAWDHLPARAGLASSSLTRVAAFGGEAAIGTGDQGVYLLRGGKVRTLGDQDGLADNWVTDLAYDARGRLWIATCTRGVSVRDEHGALRTLTTRDGLADDYALSVQELRGQISIGTLSGLSILDGERVTTLTAHDGLSGNEVHDVVDYAGAIWVATDGGLSVIEPVAAPAAVGAPKPEPAPVYSRGRAMTRGGSAMKADATLDLLLDLKHDLGKYMVLPIALLPGDADAAALRAALERALRQTRSTRGVTRSAREIWADFHDELAALLAPESGLDDLRLAVERALQWEQALATQGAIDRAALERDFQAVQVAIAVLIDEARGG